MFFYHKQTLQNNPSIVLLINTPMKMKDQDNWKLHKLTKAVNKCVLLLQPFLSEFLCAVTKHHMTLTDEAWGRINSQGLCHMNKQKKLLPCNFALCWLKLVSTTTAMYKKRQFRGIQSGYTSICLKGKKKTTEMITDS